MRGRKDANNDEVTASSHSAQHIPVKSTHVDPPFLLLLEMTEKLG